MFDVIMSERNLINNLKFTFLFLIPRSVNRAGPRVPQYK